MAGVQCRKEKRRCREKFPAAQSFRTGMKNRISVCRIPGGLLPPPELLLHRGKTCHRFSFVHIRVLFNAVEPLAHQLWAFTAVRELLIVGTTVIDRTAVNADICGPERFALGLCAAGTFFFVVPAITAGVPADGLDLLWCHTLKS